MLKRTMITGLTITLAGAGLAMSPGATAAVPQADQAAQAAATHRTNFAFGGFGFASRLRGGDIPTRSDALAFERIGCTNLAGLRAQNAEAEVDLPGLAPELSGLKTQVGTYERNGVATARTTHSIARVNLVDLPIGSLSLRGVRSTSVAFHDARGYHARTETDIASIAYQVGAVTQRFEVPAPGRTLTIPGVAAITLGRGEKSAGAFGAQASADAVRIRVLPTDTQVVLAHSAANITGGVRSGLFSGSSWATRAQALNGRITSGRTPLLLMPCQGTRGDTRTRSVTATDLGDGAIRVSGLNTRQRSQQTNSTASGYERSSVGRLSLANGRVVITGIVARAQVTRTANGVTSNARGTSVARVKVNGQTRQFPRTDVLTIPGVARLEQQIVKRSANGITVTALKVTLLDDGDLLKLELGHANLSIRGA